MVGGVEAAINGQKDQFGLTNYAVAKAGILGFTWALALEITAKAITINAIAPGQCETDMVTAVPLDILKQIVSGIPVGRLGKPGEIARLVSALAGVKAAYLTGSTISIHGGQFVSRFTTC